MAIMGKIFVHQLDSQYFNTVPEDCGVLRFFTKDTLVYIDAAVNLRRKLAGMFVAKDNDFGMGELFAKADWIETEETKTSLDALITLKNTLNTHKPEFNQIINVWKNYVYLAINPAEFPFVKITEFTEEDWFYIGPFKSRFFLAEMMELMSKLLKLPHCEVKKGPCEKLEYDTCRGWCLLIKSEVSGDSDNSSEHPNLHKLDALLKEAYIHADNGLLEMVQNEKKKYDDELQFIKADLLTEHIELLRRYKKWLVFLYEVKNLNFDIGKVSVKNGQLVKYQIGDAEQSCPFVKIAYRPNEILAVNKNLIDEGWILYQERA
jgi:excinuclease ABC subunit C